MRRRLGAGLLPLAVGLGLALPGAAAGAPYCTGAQRLVQWPTAAPVWEMCVLAPSVSTGSNGSGLELTDVHYNGHLVLERAHAPILNVLYAAGCGCFRDWSDSEVRFQADNVIVTGPGGYAEPTTPPLTVCEAGGSGGDVGGFRGVAAEKLADSLILTTQFMAGWYRYTMRWKFAGDGTITASFGFAAITASCVSYDHTHHNYWRLDFDIDGSKGDTIYRGIPPPAGSRGSRPVGVETRGNWAQGAEYSVLDRDTRRGYQILPGNSNLPDTFAVNDYFFLQYKANEIDDLSQAPGCATRLQNFVNGESVDNGDVVVWLRGGAFHEGMELDHCGVVDYTFVPFGDWNP